MADGQAEEPAGIPADEVLGGDPQHDPEVLLLGALMWAPADQARRCADLLEAADFHRPAAEELYTLVRGLAAQGRPHQPPHVLAQLTAGHAAHGAALRRLLLDATTVGALPAHLPQHTYLVLSAAHRRGYHRVAAALVQAATEGEETDLFPLLVDLGRERRAAHTRLLGARQWAGLG